MKYIKIFEDFGDLSSEPTAEEIISAFERGDITDASKSVDVKQAWRHGGEISETTFRFKTSLADYQVLFVESETRGEDIIIRKNGSFTDIPKDSKFRQEILDRCFASIK